MLDNLIYSSTLRIISSFIIWFFYLSGIFRSILSSLLLTRIGKSITAYSWSCYLPFFLFFIGIGYFNLKIHNMLFIFAFFCTLSLFIFIFGIIVSHFKNNNFITLFSKILKDIIVIFIAENVDIVWVNRIICIFYSNSALRGIRWFIFSL